MNERVSQLLRRLKEWVSSDDATDEVDDTERRELLGLLEAGRGWPAEAGVVREMVGFVGEVEKNSPAARAQIQSGFLLTALDGIPVKDLVNSANAMGNKPAGERVQLSLLVPRRINGNLVQLQPASATVAVW